MKTLLKFLISNVHFLLTIYIYKAQGALNILPLVSKDSFLDLDKITDDQANRLDLRPNSKAADLIHSAVLRKGGVSRFDERSASELLQYLLELMKDETASFARIGGDMMKEALMRINQNIAALHQLAKEKNFIQAKNPYLIINSVANENNISTYAISYWSSLVEVANGIKPGTLLNSQNINNIFFKDNAVMIVPSSAARGKLSSQDKIIEYRSAMLSHGRIVTYADIKAYTLNHFKNAITSVHVDKGTQKEISTKKGFTRTIDITVSQNTNPLEKVNNTEWKYLCESFLLSIKKISSNTYPYRLLEKKEQHSHEKLQS